MRGLLLGGLIALRTVNGTTPQSAAPAIEVQAVGPSIGTAVPGFVLPDQRGHPRSLESILGPKGAVLVFFRSADW